MNSGIVIVELAGRIDSSTIKLLREQLEAIVSFNNHSIKTLILDMQAVEFIDSNGLGFLISTLKLSRGMKFDFIIRSIDNDQVKDFFVLTQTFKLFNIEQFQPQSTPEIPLISLSPIA